MALISCPECQREISDRVKACPHCGYPLVEDAAAAMPLPTDSNLQPQSTSIKTKPGAKKFWLAAAVIALAILIGAGVYVSESARAKAEARETWLSNLKSVHLAMLTSGADAENLGNLTRSVWYNTIFEKFDADTDPYTRNGWSFHEDFNESLQLLWAADSTQETISKINSDRDEIAAYMKALQSPPDDLVTCFNTVTDMHKAYTELVNLVTSPSGSLNSFTDNFRSADEALITQYNQLETQIPDE